MPEINETVPHDKSIDNSLALMQEGYLFIKIGRNAISLIYLKHDY